VVNYKYNYNYKFYYFNNIRYIGNFIFDEVEVKVNYKNMIFILFSQLSSFLINYTNLKMFNVRLNKQ